LELGNEVQAGLECLILQSQPLEYWDYMHVPPCPTIIIFYCKKIIINIFTFLLPSIKYVHFVKVTLKKSFQNDTQRASRKFSGTNNPPTRLMFILATSVGS
jgi:hypothetical protein